MGDESQVKIKLITTADSSGVKEVDASLSALGQHSEAVAQDASKAGDALAAIAQAAAPAVEQVAEVTTATNEIAGAAEHAEDAMGRFVRETAAEMEALKSKLDEVQSKLAAPADTSGVQRTRDVYDELFDDLKAGVVDALSGEGVDTKFIGHVADEFDLLKASLKETGASGDEVAQKIAQMEQQLQAAAAAEEKRVRQLKVNFEMALHEKDVQEEAAALQRRRRQEDQLAMEAEGRLLKENTEKLEQEIMARLRAERVAREAAEAAKGTGESLKGVQRDMGGAAMQAAYFFDDLQYGFKAVSGQLPQLAMALGMGGGLAGILSLAATAANLLWEKFGRADEAKQKTDKVTASVHEMEAALKRASDAAEKTWKADLSKYTAEVDKATGAWEKAGDKIQQIISYHNELAAVQQKILNSQLEIQRQTELAAANTDDERKAVNMKYDAQKGALNDSSEVEKAKRNLDAEEAKAEMLRRQHSNVANQKDDAEGRVGQAEKDRDTFVDQFGHQSDQGRRVSEAEAAQKRLLDLQQQIRDKDEARRGIDPIDEPEKFADLVEEVNKLKAQIEAAAKDRDIKNTGIQGDKDALDAGKGLTFDRLKAEADAAAKAGDDNAAGLAKVQDEAVSRQKRINDALEASTSDLDTATKSLAQLREEQVDNEKQLALKKLQQQAAEEKYAEGFAKSGTAQDIADKDAKEKQRKQQLEEQARKLENDAKEAALREDPKADELRRKAERAKLPDDATAEQRRALELEQAKREQDGRKGMPEPVVDASSVTAPLANLAKNLGPAGSALAKAVAQMRDGGATAKEMQTVIAHVEALGPLINKRLGEQDKQIASLEKSLQKLISQVRSSRL